MWLCGRCPYFGESSGISGCYGNGYLCRYCRKVLSCSMVRAQVRRAAKKLFLGTWKA